MAKTDDEEEERLLDCEVCLKEIPLSEDSSDEVREYVSHYCGIECYQRWREGEGEPQSS